jgi:hypothetical protein
MIKKALVAVIAAGALSVPLAGVAWAEPQSDPGNGGGIGAGGLPGAAGKFLGGLGENPSDPNNPTSTDPASPGLTFSNTAKVPNLNNPAAYGDALNAFAGRHPELGIPPGSFGDTPPGMGAKAFTPGCANGHSTGICIP